MWFLVKLFIVIAHYYISFSAFALKTQIEPSTSSTLYLILSKDLALVYVSQQTLTMFHEPVNWFLVHETHSWYLSSSLYSIPRHVAHIECLSWYKEEILILQFVQKRRESLIESWERGEEAIEEDPWLAISVIITNGNMKIN